MNTNVNVILGPTIVDGDIYRFISTPDESGIIETWNAHDECWTRVWYYQSDITPDKIAKGEALSLEELSSLTDLRKMDDELKTYNAKDQVDSASWQALCCFEEASKLDVEYRIDSKHLNSESFLILFRGDKSLHRKVFEFLLKALDQSYIECDLDKFYIRKKLEKNEKIDHVLQGPLLVKEKKKIIRVVEERPGQIKRLDVFEGKGFRAVKHDDSVSWYDLRDAQEISLTQFYDMVRPPIDFIHIGKSSLKQNED